jgi:fatty acid CoA ligase FadD9
MSALKQGLKKALGKVRQLVTRDDSAIGTKNPGYVTVGFYCNVCWKPIHAHEDNYKCTDCYRSYNLCSACYHHGEAERHLEEFGFQHVIIKETEIINHGPGCVVGSTIEETFLNMFKYYPQRPAIGEYDQEVDNYRYTTFSDLQCLIHKFYSGLDALMSEVELASNFVAFCGNTSLQWYIADFACIFLGAPTIPIGVAVDPGSMAFILNQTEAGVLVCDASMLDIVASNLVPQCPHLKYVIVMKAKCKENQELPKGVPESVRILPFEAVLEKGESNLVSLTKNKLKADDILTIVYTSGSTGAPKGCVFTREIYRMRTAGKMKGELLNNSLSVWFSFQPPSHLLERKSTHYTLMKGGKVGIYRGSMDHIFEDIAFVRPTLFAATPRFYNVIYDQFQQTLKELTEKYKMEAISQRGDESLDPKDTATPQSDSPQPKEPVEPSPIELTPEEKAFLEAKNQYKDILGGRCLIIVTGGAATGKAVKKFLQDVLTMFVSDGYGTTEAGGVASNENVIAEDIKLVDVPEMGYLTTDDPPRGEVWVRNPVVIAGYYKNEEETADKFQDGYFRTGDIAVMKSKDEITLIDRRKNIFKLAQGEFIAPSRLETIFTDDSQYIEHIFIYGQALWKNVVAVVVPFRTLTEQWWLQQHSDRPAPFEEICQSDIFREFLLQEIRTIAASHHLPGWEIPIDVLVVPESFTPENGLLTVTFKLCRPKLELKYKEKLEELYEAANNDGEAKIDIEEQFVNLVTACFLGNSREEFPSIPPHFISSSFSQLGCDSIAALAAVNTLKRRLHVEVPIEKLMVCSVLRLVQFLEQEMGKKVQNPSLVDHLRKKCSSEASPKVEDSLGYPEIMYNDCNLNKWLKDENLVPNFQTGTGSGSENGSKHVLLTGSAGFLGRHILLSLLSDKNCSKVFCHLRKRPDVKDDPREYLWKVLESSLSGTEDLRQVFEEKVVLVVGDLSKPLLGLDMSTFDHLGATVDVVIHNGAHVNHVLPYANLRDANVCSTKELLKLCFLKRAKFFHFVSTSGVLHGSLGGSGKLDENADLSEMKVENLPGYSQTKWVSEQLIFKAAERGFVRGAISRPGMIGPHTRTGEGNEKDWLHALLRAIVEVGVVPERAHSMLHLIPVDYVAECITAISIRENNILSDEQGHPVFRSNCEVYHFVNSDHPLSYSSIFESLHCLHPQLEASDYRSFRQKLSEMSTRLNNPTLTTANSLLPSGGTEPPATRPIANSTTSRLMTLLVREGRILGNMSANEYVFLYLKRYFSNIRDNNSEAEIQQHGL